MITFSDFIQKNNLKNKATSNIKFYQLFSSLGVNEVGIYLRNGPFQSDIGIVKLHPTKGTHWVCYRNEKYFDSYGVVCLKKLSNIIIKRNGFCLYSEYKIQGLTSKKDIYCASYCFYKIYLTKVVGIDFKSANLNLY